MTTISETRTPEPPSRRASLWACMAWICRSRLVMAAALLRAGQRDCSQVAQHADVMAHGREWLIEGSRELHGTRFAAFHENFEDPPAERMCKRLDEGFVEGR